MSNKAYHSGMVLRNKHHSNMLIRLGQRFGQGWSYDTPYGYHSPLTNTVEFLHWVYVPFVNWFYWMWFCFKWKFFRKK